MTKYIRLVDGPEPDVQVMFSDTIWFRIDVAGYSERKMEQVAEQRLKEICTWCCNTFQHNFVIIEHADVRIAGGWADNRSGWKQEGSRVHRQDYAWQASYELRCFQQDAAWFKMKWA